MHVNLKNLTEDERKEYNKLITKKIHSAQGGNALSEEEEVKFYELANKATSQQRSRGGRRRPKSSNKRSIRRRSSKARQSRKSRATRRK